MGRCWTKTTWKLKKICICLLDVLCPLVEDERDEEEIGEDEELLRNDKGGSNDTPIRERSYSSEKEKSKKISINDVSPPGKTKTFPNGVLKPGRSRENSFAE